MSRAQNSWAWGHNDTGKLAKDREQQHVIPRRPTIDFTWRKTFDPVENFALRTYLIGSEIDQNTVSHVEFCRKFLNLQKRSFSVNRRPRRQMDNISIDLR